MDQIKAHYDRYLLALAGLVLAAVAVMLALAAGGLSEQFTPTPVQTDGQPFADDPSIVQLNADRAQLEERQNWEESKGSLFVSRVYLLRGENLVDILESDVELFPGIANAWILEHNLDYTDPALPDVDPDGDGFTNLEEFMAKTNP
ncbi:MAG: Amuc_1099 family pilus-like system protein, partial [Chthoniobacterales bacterium]